MKLENPKLTMFINRDYTTIEIKDSKSNTILAEVRITPEQLSAVLSRQGYVDCECLTGDLSRIGKKHENKHFEFEIDSVFRHDKIALINKCKEELYKNNMSEWIPDNYFGAQDSFFLKDGKYYARAIIRRWI